MKFDPNTFINADLTLYAHYAAPSELVKVQFTGSDFSVNRTIKNGYAVSGSYKNVSAVKANGATTIYVSKKDNKLAAWELPADKTGDSKALTGWETNGTTYGNAPFQNTVKDGVQVSDDALTTDLTSVLPSQSSGVNVDLKLAGVTTDATSVKFHKVAPGVSDGSATPYEVDVPWGSKIELPTGEDAFNAAAGERGTEWAEQAGATGAVVNGQLYAAQTLNNGYRGGYWNVYFTKTQQAFHVTYYTEINGKDRPFKQAIVDAGSSAPSDAPAARQGDFAFSHYSDGVQNSGDHQYKAAFDGQVNSDKFLAAQWATDKAGVDFYLNYGATDNKVHFAYTTGDEFTLPTDSTDGVARDGWSLAGWYVKVSTDAAGNVTGSNPFLNRSSAYYTGNEAEFGYYKAGSNGQWGNSAVKKGLVYKTNGGHTQDYYDQWKLADNARLRIDENGRLQWLDQTANPQTDPSTGNTTYTPEWKTIPGTLYAAWNRAEKSDANDAFNRVPTDQAGNNDLAKYYKNYEAVRPELDALKAELANPNLTNAQSAALQAKIEAAQAKLQVKTDQKVYRLYNPATSDHYFTTDLKAYDYLQNLGWQGEKAKFNVVSAKTVDENPQLAYNATALYSAYNPTTREHLLVQSVERDVLATSGWSIDNGGEPVFYAPNAGGEQPLYVCTIRRRGSLRRRPPTCTPRIPVR